VYLGKIVFYRTSLPLSKCSIILLYFFFSVKKIKLPIFILNYLAFIYSFFNQDIIVVIFENTHNFSPDIQWLAEWIISNGNDITSLEVHTINSIYGQILFLKDFPELQEPQLFHLTFQHHIILNTMAIDFVVDKVRMCLWSYLLIALLQRSGL